MAKNLHISKRMGIVDAGLHGIRPLGVFRKKRLLVRHDALRAG